jgi:hypothetical protein
MHRHIEWEIQTIAGGNLLAFLYGENKEAAAFTGMTGDGAEILTSDTDFHESYLSDCS